MRKVLTAALGAVVLIGAMAAPSAGAEPPPITDPLRAFSVIPPGQNGLMTASDYVLGGVIPHGTDQLQMYASLIDDDDITEEELPTYFHSFQFGPTSIEKEYLPREDVTVFRDNLGIPHIYATTDEGAAFAIGYVTAQDRQWQMDLLRHAAEGRLASWLGPDYVTYDKETRRDGYTDDELQQIVDDLDDRFGADGARVQTLLEAYTDGVNKRFEESRTLATAAPVEYQGQGVAIEDWRTIDTAAIAVLQLRQFGETAGGEMRNAALYQALTKRLGTKKGKKAFRDFLWLNDVNTIPTIAADEGAFPSQDLGDVDPAAVAIPDNSKAIVDRILHLGRVSTKALKGLGLQAPASSFLAVAPSKSETGNTLEYGGPQVGYSAPQFFMEQDVHSPSFDFRGPAVPGASLLVPVGRGIDYAWSLTTGVSDAVDTRVELLCNPDGGTVAKNSTNYMFDGECRTMETRMETVRVKEADGPTSQKIFEIQRTIHGPVIDRGTVGGAPVAVVRERDFWMREADSIVAFMNMQSNEMDSVAEFTDAVAQMTLSFNVLYADDQHIAYFHAGTYPMRARGVDPMLPVWGTGEWEWNGDLPFSMHPQVVDPAQGWIANWNNQPSTGWNNGDSTFWGPSHRYGLLDSLMDQRLSGRVVLSDLADVIATAATQDARAILVGPGMLDATAGMSGDAKKARNLIEAWVADGANREDMDHNGKQDSGPAVAVYDKWFGLLMSKIFDDELGRDNYVYVGMPSSDDPTVNNGSSFFADFSNLLFNLYGPGLSTDFCDNMTTDKKETCKQLTKRTLKAAVKKLAKSKGNNMSSWTKTSDKLDFDAVGALEIDSIPWQNRGTYNHLVEVLGSR